MKLNRRGLGTGLSRSRILLVIVVVASLGAAVLRIGGSAHTSGGNAVASAPFSGRLPRSTRSASPDHARALYAHAPVVFEANQGQSDSRVRFLARGSGYSLFLTDDEAVLKLQHLDASAATSSPVIQMRIAGANTLPNVSGVDLLPGQSNYLIGNTPALWHTHVPQFARVRYQGIYPGVDLVYYGHQGSLEYDFIVAPGADPKSVALSFSGTDRIGLNAAGDLVLSVDGGSIALQAPRVYQRFAQEERPVGGQFELRAQNKVGFRIGDYDHSRDLIIDPVLTYSSYLGGTGTEGCITISGTTTNNCPTIAVDNGFNFYVTGSTTSTDFPLTPGTTSVPFQSTLKAPPDVFVTKFSASGSAILFSTYLGGNGSDASAGIAVDSGFNVYVAGTTRSTDFPTTATTAYQTAAKSAGNHVFVSQLNSDGSTLLYSTYLSGSGGDIATGLAIDSKQNAFVVGTTTSKDFPIAPAPGAFQATSLAASQFFVSKVSTSQAFSGLQSLLYSTYFGGGSPSNGVTLGGGIAVDASGNFYITGGTNFAHTGNPATDFPILNAFQSTLLGPTDAFVAKINPGAAPGAQLLYSTYLGGTGDDVGNAIAVDNAFNAYVTGMTTSTDVALPTSVLAFQSQNNGGTDAFVAKIGNPVSGSTVFPLNYYSYLGGTGTDIGLGVGADSVQAAHITGSTTSTDFNVSNAIQSASGGGTDAFIALLSTTTNTGIGTQGQYSTYLGGTGEDRGTGIAVDPNGITYVTGDTTSPNFPVAAAFQNALKGTSDAFVTKLGAKSTVTITAGTPSPSPVGLGNQATFSYTITNAGPDTASGVTVNDILPATGATFTSATASPGACTTPTAGSVTCAVGSLNVNASATVTIVLTPTSLAPLGNSATVSANGSISQSASASVSVTDFAVSVGPSSATVTAGQPASFTVTATPEPTYSASISVSCSAGLPTGATCNFTTNPLTTTTTSAASTALVVNTTARVTTTTQVWHGNSFGFAIWLPVAGLALFGLGAGAEASRTRRVLGGILFTAMLVLILLLPSCSSSKSTTTTTGTPAGTYTVTISGTSGSASHTSTLTLVVQ